MPFSVATGIGGVGRPRPEDRHDAQQQRPGDHAPNEPARRPATATSRPRATPWPEAGDPDAGHDVPGRHPRHVAALLAGGRPASTVGRRRRSSRSRRRRWSQNMNVGDMDGYCVGEPWNAVAVKQDIGFTHIATQDIWQHHPEKALVVNEQFAEAKRRRARGRHGRRAQGVQVARRPRQPRRGRRHARRAEATSTRPPDEIRGPAARRVRPRRRPRRDDLHGRPDAVLPRRPGQLAPPGATPSGSWPSTSASAPRPRRRRTTELADELILTRPLRRGRRGRGRRRPRRRHGAVRRRARRRHVRPGRPRGGGGTPMSIDCITRRSRRPAPPGDRRAAPALPAPPPTAAPPPPRDRAVARRGAVAVAGLGWLVGFAVLVGLCGSSSPSRCPTCRRPADDVRPSCDSCWPTRSTTTGPNDKGIGAAARDSLQRVFKGFALAAVVGIPLGLLHRRQPAGLAGGQPGRAAAAAGVAAGLVPDLAGRAQGRAQGGGLSSSSSPRCGRRDQHRGRGGAVPQDQRNVARVFRFGRLRLPAPRARPHALPSIVTGLRLSMGIAWMVIVAVEMLSGGSGIGVLRLGRVQRRQPGRT